MTRKMLAILIAGSLLVTPSLASACDTVLGFRFWQVDGKSVNAGLEIVPGEDGGDTGLVFSADFTVPVGDKAAVAPMLGYCKFGDFGEIVFGAGGAVNIFNNAAGTFGLNVQAALAYDSYEGGSEQSFPIGVVGSYMASDAASITFGGGMGGYRFSGEFAGESFSDTSFDPFATGGAQFATDSVTFFAQAVLRFYEGGTDTAFNVGAGIPVG